MKPGSRLGLGALIALSIILIGLPTITAASVPDAGRQAAPTPTALPLAASSGIEVEPSLLTQWEADDTVGYLIYFRERPDLSAAYAMNWTERGQFVMKTLQKTAGRAQTNVRAYLDKQGVKYQSFWIDNVLLVEKSNRATTSGLLAFPEIAALRTRRTLQVVEPVERGTAALPQAVEPNIAHVNAPDAWALGITGLNSVVGNIDTGVRYTHQALVRQYRGNLGGGVFDHNYNWWDPYEDSPTAPADDNGHGSHTMGTMIGDDGGSNQIGMAPGARWLACRGCNTSSCTDAALLTCAQFIAAPWDLNRSNPNPDKRPFAVNNSWGDCARSYDDWFQGVVDSWQAAGIYPVFSNGNNTNCGYSSPPACNTVGNPARYNNVTGVGSTGQQDGQYAPHSNRGPTDRPDTVNPGGYPTIKPQVAAPGVNIRSSIPTSDTSYEGGWTGTSMSAPHVTGLVALMWQAGRCLIGDYARTETLIEQTAVPITTGLPGACSGEGPGQWPNQSTGWGEINALAAVQAARNACGPIGVLAGVVSNSATGNPVAGAEIQATSRPTQTVRSTSGINGTYSMTLSTGTYSVTAAAYGYVPAPINGVAIVSGTTTTQNIALTPAPSVIVSGTVTDAAAGWPLYASIDIAGYPGGKVWTNPATGFYSVSLPAGPAYGFTANAWINGYNPATRTVEPISLTANRTENFVLNADLITCAAPGYRANDVYRQDFEANNGNFTISGATSWAWGAPASGPGNAHSGNKIWATNLSGDYNDEEDGDLTSPDINLSAYAGQNLTLSWWQWLQTESCCDGGQVEVSKDGGASWTQVYEGYGDVDLGWSRRSVALGPTYAVSDFRVRFYFSSDDSVTYPGWYVDDVAIARSSSCQPQPGGLVMGNVYAASTHAALTGARVVNDNGQSTLAVATVDPAVADAFYTLFSPAGSHVFTATAHGYAASVQNPTVVISRTIWQDFDLRIKRLLYLPLILR